jgi:hypothetical protein
MGMLSVSPALQAMALIDGPVNEIDLGIETTLALFLVCLGIWF